MLIPFAPWQLAHMADFALPASMSPASTGAAAKTSTEASVNKNDFI
jgi:hypothetical protein